MKFKKSSVVAAFAAAAVLATGTAAYAFVKLTATGTGNASNVVSADQYKLVVTVGDLAQGKLVPGGNAVGVPVYIENASTAQGKVKVSKVELSLSESGPASCTGAEWAAAKTTLTLTDPVFTPGFVTVDGFGVAGWIAMEDSDTVDQTCLLGQTIPVTATVS